MRSNADQPFTTRERIIAALVIVAVILLTLAIQAVQSMARPSLGVYEANRTAIIAAPNVVDASPLA